MHNGNKMLLKPYPWCCFCYEEITAIEVRNIIANTCKMNLLRNVKCYMMRSKECYTYSNFLYF